MTFCCRIPLLNFDHYHSRVEVRVPSNSPRGSWSDIPEIDLKCGNFAKSLYLSSQKEMVSSFKSLVVHPIFLDLLLLEELRV